MGNCLFTLGSFFNYRISQKFWATFSNNKSYVCINFALFWATFSQTHLVTLALTETGDTNEGSL
jgi:hypothetical protein